MVNIDTRNNPIPRPVTRTRKISRTKDATLSENPATNPQSSDRRSPWKDRRKQRRNVLLDLRSGRDRRRVRKGRGIDIRV